MPGYVWPEPVIPVIIIWLIEISTSIQLDVTR